MLSPGQWHKQVPTEPIANLKFRLSILRQCKNNPRMQEAVRQACAQDIVFWINVFCWQINPLKTTEDWVGPFICWDYQEAALLARPEAPFILDVGVDKVTIEKGILWCYEKGKPAVIEKSRDMGATWLFLLVQMWLGMFRNYADTLNISRSEEAVDDGTRLSIFGKIRFASEHLPAWMTGEVTDNKKYYEYHRTKSSIKGTASTGVAGVGGRAAIIFIDEFSLIRDDQEVRERTANTTTCRFFNGTHVGTGTEFYNLTKTPEFVKIVMHWSQHPDKKKGLYRWDPERKQVEILDKEYQFPDDYPFITDGRPHGGPFPGLRSPWYDAKAIDIGRDMAVAMDLDIDPTGSTSKFFNTVMIRHLQNEHGRLPVWEGYLEYDAEGGSQKFVEKPGGPIKMWERLEPSGKPTLGVYGAGSDISHGTGATPSVLQIANAQTGHKVLEYANAFIDPTDFGTLLFALCSMFKDANGRPAKLCWELAGPGVRTGDRVMELGYSNVWSAASVDKLGSHRSTRPGWSPNLAGAKHDLLHDYHAALQKMLYVNRSVAALEECLLFKVNDRGDPEHEAIDMKDPTGARVNHGDRVIADALCWKMCKLLRVEEDVQEKKAPPPVLSLAWRKQYHESRRVEESWA